MADSKKYDGRQWEHSLRKLTTATEAVENPLYSDGTPITSYTIKGNEEHTGTPTPSNPVDVNGVGVRTENLYNTFDIVRRVPSVTNGELIEAVSGCCTSMIPILSGDITLTAYRNNNLQLYLFLYDTNGNFIGVRNSGQTTGSIIIKGSSIANYTNARYVRIRNDNITVQFTNIMLNTGSTPKPYEPYGYKIPISNGQQTTNIYLGSTQTTRQIKKLVLDGTENITSGHLDVSLFNIPITGYLRDLSATIVACTHYKAQKNVSGWLEPQPDVCTFYAGTAQSNIMYIRDTRYTTIEEFKAYLAAQYAAGTPVTVWYVLATPETAAVNEPLMKIGDYADTVSNAASIPTTEGANSISVDTTVQPSEFTATWTGWHDATVKEWDGSQWNE